MVQNTYRLLVLLASSSAVEAYTSFTDSGDPKTCHILGDTDIYGLGVRLGFYLHYFSTIFAIWLDPTASCSVRTQLNIFTIAVFINVYRTAKSEGSLFMLEFFIVTNMTLFLTMGTVPITLRQLWISKTSVCTMAVLWIVWMFASPWVAFKEQLSGRKPGCSVNLVLFFVPVDAYSSVWDIAFKVSSALLVVGGVVYLVLLGIAGVLYFGMDHKRRDEMDSAARGEEDVPLKRKIIQTIQMIVTGTFCVSMVEYTIMENKIDLSAAPITSTGQLLPVLVGALPIGAIAVKAIKKWVI